MPPLPPSIVSYLGAIFAVFIGLFITTSIQEFIKRWFRNGRGDRRSGDNQVFDKMVELQQSFIEHIRLANESREKTNRALEQMLEQSSDHYHRLKHDLSKIREIVEK